MKNTKSQTSRNLTRRDGGTEMWDGNRAEAQRPQRRRCSVFGVIVGAVSLCGAACAATDARPAVVSFKDAAKIKSWDAWDDHKAKAAVTNILQKEKRCVTWARLNRLDPGLPEIGRLQTRTSAEVRSSKWSVGCERDSLE